MIVFGILPGRAGIPSYERTRRRVPLQRKHGQLADGQAPWWNRSPTVSLLLIRMI